MDYDVSNLLEYIKSDIQKQNVQQTSPNSGMTSITMVIVNDEDPDRRAGASKKYPLKTCLACQWDLNDG